MKRLNVRAIMADPVQKRRLLIGTIIATQAREGITTTWEQAAEAYDKVNAGKDPGMITPIDTRHFAGLSLAQRSERDRRIANDRVQEEARTANGIQQQFPGISRDEALRLAAEIIKKGST